MYLVDWSRTFLFAVKLKDAPDVGQDRCPFGDIIPLINVVFAKSVRETYA
jgi:hypothetical protein